MARTPEDGPREETDSGRKALRKYVNKYPEIPWDSFIPGTARELMSALGMLRLQNEAAAEWLQECVKHAFRQRRLDDAPWWTSGVNYLQEFTVTQVKDAKLIIDVAQASGHAPPYVLQAALDLYEGRTLELYVVSCLSAERPLVEDDPAWNGPVPGLEFNDYGK
jgi:hypothetical protein